MVNFVAKCLVELEILLFCNLVRWEIWILGYVVPYRTGPAPTHEPPRASKPGRVTLGAGPATTQRHG